MRFLNKIILTVSVSAFSFFSNSVLIASAGMMKDSGVVCWTGEIEFIRTTEKDMAWVWTIDWTYMPDDRNMLDNAQSGKCLGSGGMVDGKPEPSTQFCKHIRKDGATFMSRGIGGPQGNEGTMFGGTGTFEGVVGGYVGSAQIQLPADEGRIAGCRPSSAEWTLKG